MARFDERDTIFSRMTLEPGTPRFSEYYARNPHFEAVDKAFREAPPGEFAHRIVENRFVDSTFGLIADLRRYVRGPVAEERQIGSSPEFSKALESEAASLGAALSGATSTNLDFCYSVRGRGEKYGHEVDTVLPFLFVMGFEMDREETETAPDIRQSVEVVRTYLEAAVAALTIARWIRSLGWDAVAHMDGESEVVLPPAAAATGLGEIGRHGLLLTQDYGCRVRLSAVSTDMPLDTGSAASIVEGGLSGLCSRCGRCAAACPAGAIPVNSVSGKVNHEACFGMWKCYGTDCGICLAACPFSRGSGKK